jgi:hypothetical protein
MILGERDIYGKFTGIDAAQVTLKKDLLLFWRWKRKMRVRRQPILAMSHRYKRHVVFISHLFSSL